MLNFAHRPVHSQRPVSKPGNAGNAPLVGFRAPPGGVGSVYPSGSRPCCLFGFSLKYRGFEAPRAAVHKLTLVARALMASCQFLGLSFKQKTVLASPGGFGHSLPYKISKKIPGAPQDESRAFPCVTGKRLSTFEASPEAFCSTSSTGSLKRLLVRRPAGHAAY